MMTYSKVLLEWYISLITGMVHITGAAHIIEMVCITEAVHVTGMVHIMGVIHIYIYIFGSSHCQA